jgi:hypothetical protein
MLQVLASRGRSRIRLNTVRHLASTVEAVPEEQKSKRVKPQDVQVHDLDDILTWTKPKEYHPYHMDPQAARTYGKSAYVPREQYTKNWQKRLKWLDELRQRRRSTCEVHVLNRPGRVGYFRALPEYMAKLNWYANQMYNRMKREDPIERFKFMSRVDQDAEISGEEDTDTIWDRQLKKNDHLSQRWNHVDPNYAKMLNFRRIRRQMLEFERWARETLDPTTSNHPIPRMHMRYYEQKYKGQEATPYAGDPAKDFSDGGRDNSDNDLFIGTEGEEDMLNYQIQKGLITSATIENELGNIFERTHEKRRLLKERMRAHGEDHVAAIEDVEVALWEKEAFEKGVDDTAEEAKKTKFLDAASWFRTVGPIYVEAFKNDGNLLHFVSCI